MLNAKARSKAKLPICAMLGIPNVFFQKARRQATGAVGYGGRERPRSDKMRERSPRSHTFSHLSQKRRDIGHPLSGAEASLAPPPLQRANVTRSAGGSAGESRARRPASLRLRGRVQIHDAQRANRRGGGLGPLRCW